MPPIAAPVMFVAFSASRSVAFACCNIGVVTVCGTMPLLAGKKNAVEAPLTDARTASCQICAWPVSSSTATTAWLAPLARFDATITWWRGRRSAQTPPKSRRHEHGDLARGEHDSEVRRRAGQIEHAESERDRGHRTAHHRDRATGKEQAELAVAEWPEPAQADCQFGRRYDSRNPARWMLRYEGPGPSPAAAPVSVKSASAPSARAASTRASKTADCAPWRR